MESPKIKLSTGYQEWFSIRAICLWITHAFREVIHRFGFCLWITLAFLYEFIMLRDKIWTRIEIQAGARTRIATLLMHPQDVTAPRRHISKCPAHNKALVTIIYESQKKPCQGSRFRECFFLLVIMIRICAIVCLMSVTHSHFPLKGCAKNSFRLDLRLALALKASIHLDNYRGSFLNLTLKACGN